MHPKSDLRPARESGPDPARFGPARGERTGRGAYPSGLLSCSRAWTPRAFTAGEKTAASFWVGAARHFPRCAGFYFGKFAKKTTLCNRRARNCQGGLLARNRRFCYDFCVPGAQGAPLKRRRGYE